MNKQIVIITGCKDHKVYEYDKKQILNLIAFKQKYTEDLNKKGNKNVSNKSKQL